MNAADLERTWYGAGTPPLWLRTLEPVYAAGFALSQRLGDARRESALEGRPVVVVGNVTVGGSGKTPLVIRLCELVREAGFLPGVASRGYGRKSRGQLRVFSDSDPALTGDEPVMIARRTNAPVFVDAHREAAALRLFDRGADVVIADDGLQRASLPRRLEICVVDGARGLGNGHLLPAGPLREPAERLFEVDHVIVTGSGRARLPVEGVSMKLEPGPFRSVAAGDTLDHRAMADHVRDRVVHAVAGIGHPRRFFDQLDALGIHVESHHPFPDHHRYVPADFAALTGTVLMTEKDAVKCDTLGLNDAWYLQVDARLPERWERKFVSTIEGWMAEGAGAPS